MEWASAVSFSMVQTYDTAFAKNVDCFLEIATVFQNIEEIYQKLQNKDLL